MLTKIMTLFVVFELSTAEVVLRSLHYNVEVSSRIADTELRATFVNTDNSPVNKEVHLLIPEDVLVTSFYMKSQEVYYISSIVKKKETKRKMDGARNNTIQLHQKTARAQKLEVNIRFVPEESVVISVGYTQILRRKRALYHVPFYLPEKKSYDVDLDISIHMTGKINNLSFLKADGHETPLRTIQRGTAEVYSSSDKELRFKYKRRQNSNTQFASVIHGRNSQANKNGGKPHMAEISFKPNHTPRLYLADPAFVLSFDTERFPEGGLIQIQDEYFAHFISPEGLEKLPVHTVFVLDISGSMDELQKLTNLKTAMKITLKSLRSEDSFEVFVFSTNVKSLGIFSGSARDINRSITKINSLRAYGGTNINDALLDSVYGANDYQQELGIKQIVFLTDGNRTVGEMDGSVIRRDVRKANHKRLPIYALAFGNDADMKFLRQVSGENRGFARKIRSEGRPADQLKGFYEEISTPLLTGLDVQYPPDQVEESTVVKSRQDSFYSGDEVVLAGKLKDGRSTISPVVKADGAQGRIQLKISRKDILEAAPKNDSGVVERLWAYLSVQDLLSAHEFIDDDNIRKELRARALAIALRYKFVTRLTSMEINPFTLYQGIGPPTAVYAAHHGLPTSVREELEKGFTLVSPEDFAATLPNELQGSLRPSQNRRFSFVDNDPHFVVQVSGLPLPLCFDLHGQPGDILSLVRDEESGLVVNAEVRAAIGRPRATYFTRLFISLSRINLTISTTSISINCFRGDKENEVSEIWHDTDVATQPRKKRVRRRRTFAKHYKRQNRRKRIRTQRDLFQRTNRHNHHCLNCDGVTEEEDDSTQSTVTPTNIGYSPVIDAYLERNHNGGSRSRVSPKTIKIVPNFDAFHNSSENDEHLTKHLQKKGFVNHFLYTYPTSSGQNLIIRSSISIGPPKIDGQEDLRVGDECNKEFSWEYITQRRYDDVVLTVRGRRRRKRLDIVVSDVRFHVVITNTRNRHGQDFLGFYIQEQNILTPSTTGVIGQFVYKTVETIGDFPQLKDDPQSYENKVVPLSVQHMPRSDHPMPTRIEGVVSKRRSLLHRERVLCLHVKRHGKGLLTKKPKEYLLPSLFS